MSRTPAGRSATLDPADFVAFEIDQRKAFVRGGDGEGAHWVTPSWWDAVFGVGQHQAAEIVALQLEVDVGHGWFRDGRGLWEVRGARGSGFGIDVADLRHVQLVVMALGHQLVVVADLDDAAAVHDHQPVGLAQRAQAVGDGDGGAALTRLSSAFWISFSVSVSTAEVASSRIRMRGSISRARAMEMRWRSPPDSPGRVRRPANRSRAAGAG